MANVREKMININGIYIDPYIPYDPENRYRGFPQGDLKWQDEDFGCPLRNTIGMQIIYNRQHMNYKSTVFIAPVDYNWEVYPAYKCVIAPLDGTMKTVKGKPALECSGGIILFEFLGKPRMGGKQKGEVIGEVMPVTYDADPAKEWDDKEPTRYYHGVLLTYYKALDGEVHYIPDMIYNIGMIE